MMTLRLHQSLHQQHQLSYTAGAPYTGARGKLVLTVGEKNVKLEKDEKKDGSCCVNHLIDCCLLQLALILCLCTALVLILQKHVHLKAAVAIILVVGCAHQHCRRLTAFLFSLHLC